jgi:hypothetical protein
MLQKHATILIKSLCARRGVDHVPYVVNALIDAYASRGEGVADARTLFDALGSRCTAASWTSMIAGGRSTGGYSYSEQ